MTDLINQLLQWVAAHPNLAGATVCLLAFSESLAGVGLIVPGALAMFGVGALIAIGTLAFWPIYAWSVVGAVLGDGLSYWLGSHFHERIRTRWPFSRHPDWLEKGEDFFRRHGGKSIFLGRFVGPIRPVIPVVAGMLGMPPGRFYLANILSAFGWAPTYLLPGMAFGASLALAGEVAGRLAVLITLLLVGVWAVVWLSRWLYRHLQPHAQRWSQVAMDWGRRHRHLGWVLSGLVDPQQPVSRSLLAWLVLLTGGAWLFFGVLEDVLSQDPLTRADHAMYQFLQGLRNPVGDSVMVAFSELGDLAVTLPTLLVAIGWLLWHRQWGNALYWLAAVGFGLLVVVAIKTVLQVPGPVTALGGWEAYSFPSEHATLSVIIYGYLAVNGAREFPPRWRWVPYAGAGVLIGGIALSRLYLGSHWLSDVVAGLGLGLAWVALSAIAQRRHALKRVAARGLSLVGGAVLCLAGVWHITASLDVDLTRYAPRHVVRPVEAPVWWNQGLRELPAYRLDLEGEYEQPLNIQWAGELPAVERYLAERGWTEPLAMDWRTALHWLLPSPPLSELPLLPRLHNGRFEALLRVYRSDEAASDDKQLVLYLWPTDIRLQPGDTPLWVGMVAWQYLQRLPLVSFPRNGRDYDQPLALLAPMLEGRERKRVRRQVPVPTKKGLRWSGDVLLVRDPGH